jgi:hypothetical protein
MQNHALKPALQAFFHDSGFARYSIPVLLSPRHRPNYIAQITPPLSHFFWGDLSQFSKKPNKTL